jgi:hypothetical protein
MKSFIEDVTNCRIKVIVTPMIGMPEVKRNAIPK